MTPATLLLLWFTNWAVVSAVAIFFVKNEPTQGSSRLDLWGLQENLPALAGWLLLAWPVALLRLLPAIVPAARR
ncbi:hypothetical protein [Streptomyces sp. NPDC087297]|uniref:hypothetical protein n=1 Tax=Streptomyces sp. NPDC087297 TaxID=3365778 RepID=UPI00380A2499